MALLSLDGVSKTYANGTLALQDTSLAIGEHEFVSLLGPSGCGKSTALRIVAGLIEPTQGQVKWGAQTTQDRPALSFVFQEPTLMPWSKVRGNVELPLTLRNVPSAQKREAATKALKMVGLESFADVYPRELSGGMKMRVSIARALVTAPRLLLMDEPFAALDEMTRAKLNDDVLRLWADEKFTALFVTHSVYEAVYLSTRIVVMAARPGRVVDEIMVDAPYPRTQAFRTTPHYNALCIRVSDALHKAGAHHG